MKMRTFGVVTMLGLLLTLTAASVFAQSKRSSINIPFSFTVGQKTLPAGEYTVEPIRRDSHNVWLVESKSGNANVLFATIPVWSINTPTETRLVFNNYEGQYFLSQIWIAGDVSGREVPKPRVESTLAKNGIQSKKVVVAVRGD